MPFNYSTLAELESSLGDSFFLVDLARFKQNYQDFLGAFQSHYPNTTLAYSYKTNYLPKFCRLVNEWGGRAEVVSRMEYDLAQRIGTVPERIVFNGPYKKVEDIKLALRQKSMVNLDGFHQLRFLEEYASSDEGKEQEFKVGLRVTFALPEVEPSRFGFDADGEDVAQIYQRISQLPNVKVVGLHCHFASMRRSPDLYQAIATRMLALSDELFGDTPPEYLDIGGGYASRIKLPFADMSRIYEAYGHAVGPLFKNHFGENGKTELIVEPGYAVTADTMRFVAKVLDIKQVGSRKLALLSASLNNVKPSPIPFTPPFSVVSKEAGEGEEALHLVGYTCVEYDVLTADCKQPMALGDYVIFDNVGAYTNVLQPPFIRESPPMIAYNEEQGDYQVLKKKQSFDEFFASYCLD